MTDIYDQHRAAFAQVEAYVILKDGQRVANIAFKFPRDGAGRLWAYVHWLGLSMVRGYASGCGYDKRTAACASAAKRMGNLEKPNYTDENFPARQALKEDQA
ncbi:MAG: hypothetical protein KGO96_12340 [Elusimicrobia bacterium]|nr:hypothetical protein [Elusimicrobiota bacterium]